MRSAARDTRKAPLVSIVLPTYNRPKQLMHAVEACCVQTLEDWELIVVDDGSDDGQTPAVIGQLLGRDPRIRSVRHAVNRRLPAALNTGFARARGELFTWVADDDRLRSEALQVLASTLARDAKDSVAYARFSVVDATGESEAGCSGPPEELLTRGNVVGVCFLYRRAVHEALGGYREEYFLAEDYDFWLRALGRFRFELVDRDLAVKAEHPKSLTATHGSEVARVSVDVLDDFRRSHPNLPRSRRARILGLMASYAHQAEDGIVARRLLRAGALADPSLLLEHKSLAFRLFAGPGPSRALSRTLNRLRRAIAPQDANQSRMAINDSQSPDSRRNPVDQDQSRFE